MKWKLYYWDGTTFSNEDGEWRDAPAQGVVVCVSEDSEVGRELDHGARGEFYAWWEWATKPWGFDRTGILDYMIEQGHDPNSVLADFSVGDFERAGVKLGRSVDNHVFSEILLEASQDDYFEIKSALTNREVIE